MALPPLSFNKTICMSGSRESELQSRARYRDWACPGKSRASGDRVRLGLGGVTKMANRKGASSFIRVWRGGRDQVDGGSGAEGRVAVARLSAGGAGPGPAVGWMRVVVGGGRRLEQSKVNHGVVCRPGLCLLRSCPGRGRGGWRGEGEPGSRPVHERAQEGRAGRALVS